MRRQSMQRFVQLLCAIGLLTLSGGAAQATSIPHTLVNAGPPFVVVGDEPSLEQIAEPFMINLNIPGTGGVLPGWDLTAPPNNLIFETTFDPLAGPIHKLLKNADGQNFAADDDPTNEPTLGQSGLPTFWSLSEVIVVGANSSPFTDWHERILTPGWEWFVANIQYGLPGGPVTVINDAGMIMGPDIWFFFDQPLQPGTALQITKGLQFVGPTPGFGNDMVEFDGMVEIIEWPTIPAPAALPAGLMLLGAMGLVRRRRVRSA